MVAICKSFLRPHRDYEDTVYDQTYEALFHQTLDKMYQEKQKMVSESLLFYVFNTQSPRYLLSDICKFKRAYVTRNDGKLLV